MTFSSQLSLASKNFDRPSSTLETSVEFVWLPSSVVIVKLLVASVPLAKHAGAVSKPLSRIVSSFLGFSTDCSRIFDIIAGFWLSSVQLRMRTVVFGSSRGSRMENCRSIGC